MRRLRVPAVIAGLCAVFALAGCTVPTRASAMADAAGLHWALCDDVSSRHIEFVDLDSDVVMWAIDGVFDMSDGDVLIYGQVPDSHSDLFPNETVTGPAPLDLSARIGVRYLWSDGVGIDSANFDLSYLKPGVWTDNEGLAQDGPCGKYLPPSD